MSAAGGSSSRPEIEAARLVLARMGLSPEDLLDASAPRAEVPTFAEYLPKVEKAVSAGTRRVYSSYWKRVLARWGQRRLDEPTASEIKQLAEQVKGQVVLRRNARGGHSAAEHLLAALRCVYNHAIADGLIKEADNPARKVPKPRRQPSARCGLQDSRLAEINQAITTRRYDHLWQRLGKHLPWVATQGISTHWLRHTTLTWVERSFGYAVARAYAGHTDSAGDGGTTTTYIRANLTEIATALAAMTGEPHPLAAQ